MLRNRSHDRMRYKQLRLLGLSITEDAFGRLFTHLFRLRNDNIRVIKHQGIKMRTEQELKLHVVLMFALNG